VKKILKEYITEQQIAGA